MILSLTDHPDGKHGFSQVPVGDILFIEFDRLLNRVLFHTSEQVYYSMGTFKFYVEALAKSGCAFNIVDRNYAVSMSKVVLIDRERGIIYFDSNVTKDSKKCTIAFSNFNSIVAAVRAVNPSLILL